MDGIETLGLGNHGVHDHVQKPEQRFGSGAIVSWVHSARVNSVVSNYANDIERFLDVRIESILDEFTYI